MSTEVTVHGTGTGVCGLTSKEADGLTVTFQDGTLSETFLSWKGFQQLLGMKTGKNRKAPAVPPPVPAVSSLPAPAAPK